ncbi:MAG: hypothetical protein NT070_17865 [Cyanobacteria bacterium]|nr:hypothetical protein [Cyanobacteriota bacterium]
MKRYSVQKIGNLFIVKASIGRLNAQPSIVQLLVDTGASQTGLPIDFLTDIGCPITATTPQRKIMGSPKKERMNEQVKKRCNDE